MENKFVPGIIIGAIVGGAATLADKSTRNALVQSFKDIKEGNRSRKPSKITLIKMKYCIGKIQLKKFVVIIRIRKIN